MSLAAKLLSASGGEEKLYAEDVFSAYTYTGNGSTQTINNGIDLAGKGGLVWTKNRNNSFGTTGQSTSTSNFLWDFTTGKYLNSDNTDAGDNISGQFQPLSNGFFVNTNHAAWNASGGTQLQASWTFRKAPKFFDVVTYTGNGVAGRQIPHALGIAPGMVIVKCTTNSSYHWAVYHRTQGASKYAFLNATVEFQTSTSFWGGIEPTSSDFYVDTSATCNGSGQTFVAYLFAHDPSADGIIQCGSWVSTGSGAQQVSLGFEPQYILYKQIDNTSAWSVFDNMRGLGAATSGGVSLFPDSSSAEATGVNARVYATGFMPPGMSVGTTWLYLAIRRPNKPPTTGTEVFHVANPNSGSTVHTTGFPADLVIQKSVGFLWESRLVGDSVRLDSSSTSTETTANSWRAFTLISMDLMRQVYLNNTGIGTGQCGYAFKRAPGFMDAVCYTGTDVARTVPHGLGVVPELMIVKCRSVADNWMVYHKQMGNTPFLVLNKTDAQDQFGTPAWSGGHSSSSFGLDSGGAINGAARTYVAYLFATLPGISKVGSYTGNGTTQTIDCGFTTGARFILIKRTDAAGDWYVWDTVRGLVAGNDPHLSLNSTAAEITTDDSLDPASVGFIVNQLAATNINVTSASYIYLSFA